jgi:hypothetical protein
VKKIILFAINLWPLFSYATIWQVGLTKAYTKPSQVSSLVNIGDTVEIDAATYIGDVCVWSKSNLLLKGVGGRAHLRANGNYVLGKGIWVLAGNNIRVQNIEFSEAAVPDQNGAGIRLDGNGIKVSNCYFHNNENGILTSNSNTGTIAIDNSEFGFNGDGVGFAHNIYIGHVDSAIIRFCYFHHANVGHEFKSRARVNYLLYNRFSNEANGNASREIDLPNGGMSILIGNIIQQGPSGLNSNIVGYGLEGLINTAPHQIYLINNTIVNERSAGAVFLQANASTSMLKIYNNIFAGPGSTIAYGGSNAAVDSGTNKVVNNISQVGFINAASYNYKINTNSSSVNSGSNPGITSSGFNLAPTFEYEHPISSNARSTTNNIDVGAYEYVSVLPLHLLHFIATVKQQKVLLQWHTINETNINTYEIMYSIDGINFVSKKIISAKNNSINDYEWIDNNLEGANYYRLKIIDNNSTIQFSKIISIINKQNNDALIKILLGNKQLNIYNLPSQFKNTTCRVNIINAAGAFIFSQQFKFSNLENYSLPFNMPEAECGYVVVRIVKNDGQISVPVFIR